MKVILSRKGMDSASGRMDSPILPDGTLLSLPIPVKENGLTPYHNLFYKGTNYLDVIRSLKPKSQFTDCHLDPDIYAEATCRPQGWKAAFGQSEIAASHLDGNSVGPGDLFLFFGRFRKTVCKNGVLKYERNAPAQHVIFGYLKVKRLLTDQTEITQECPWHPHAFGERKNNHLYLAEKYGTFHLHNDLILTKAGQSRLSLWSLPALFADPAVSISYHNKQIRKLVEGRTELVSVGRGQEFVITAHTTEAERELCSWAEMLTCLD
ncbi:MAG: hypothetical protein IKN89_12925 [Oscillospiraceae bacterium]|nr:hypothetical protein [Oscillospiraceae bacterium]